MIVHGTWFLFGIVGIQYDLSTSGNVGPEAADWAKLVKHTQKQWFWDSCVGVPDFDDVRCVMCWYISMSASIFTHCPEHDEHSQSLFPVGIPAPQNGLSRLRRHTLYKIQNRL